jgi:quercetin dioxygenase-like cupin family protein
MQLEKALTIVLVLMSSVLGMGSPRADPEAVSEHQRPGIIVTRIFTGIDGETHAEDVVMKTTSTDLSTEVSEMEHVSGVQFRHQAPNYFENWHNAPRKQYVITLSGRGEIELSDGKKVSLYPGRILILEDVTGKGHISRGVGAEARVSVLIPLAE